MMRYTCTVEIAVPPARVIELMTDPDRMVEWVAGLASVTTVRGERGQVGSVNELRFSNAPGDGVMLERLESMDESHHHAIYQLGPVTNHQRSSFEALPDGGTRWVAEHEFITPPGMLEQMGPGAEHVLRDNTQRSMQNFRQWAEAEA